MCEKLSRSPQKNTSQFLLIGIALWLNLLSLTAQAQQIDLGTASQYAGFFFGNVSKIPDIKGRLALAGDLSIGGTSIGGSIPADSTQPSLIVGGSLKAFTGGTIKGSGNKDSFGVYVGTKASAIPTYLDLKKVSVSPIDFDAERAYLTILSKQLKEAPTTGTVSQSFSAVTLTGSNRDIEVFQLPATQVTNTLNFVLKNIKTTAYIILNVVPDAQRQVNIGVTMSEFSGRYKHVLFNLPDTDVLTMTNVHVYGSILAPNACVKNSSGTLDGTIVAASWDASMSIGYGPFEPTP